MHCISRYQSENVSANWHISVGIRRAGDSWGDGKGWGHGRRERWGWARGGGVGGGGRE